MRLFDNNEQIVKEVKKEKVIETITMILTIVMLIATVLIPGSLTLAGLVVIVWMNLNSSINKKGWEIAQYVLANRVTLVQQVVQQEEDVPLMSDEEVARQRRLQELEAEMEALKNPQPPVPPTEPVKKGGKK